MKIFRLSFLLMLTVGSSAFADTVDSLVYSKCDKGFLTIALTSVVNYKMDESDRVVGLRSLWEFADEEKIECQSEDRSFSIIVGGDYPAKFRLVETKGNTVVRETWLRASHGSRFHATDRQIRMGNGIFSVCSRPAKLNRDPTLLDMTGFDCIDLVER